MKLLAATNNKNKLREFKEILTPLGFDIISMAESGIEADPEENGITFLENAMIKATEICRLANVPVLADDSGLEVDALDGAPGIYSARYAPGSDSDRVNKLLSDMEGKENRAARFVSAVVICYPDGKSISAIGTCEGVISDAPAGENGFGYDPIFYVQQYERTYAQLSADEKNAISHRGVALRKLREKLEGEEK